MDEAVQDYVENVAADDSCDDAAEARPPTLQRLPAPVLPGALSSGGPPLQPLPALQPAPCQQLWRQERLTARAPRAHAGEVQPR